jgi:hypothetical protein
MVSEVEKRGQLISHLEQALALADEIEDGNTGLISGKTVQWVAAGFRH